MSDPSSTNTPPGPPPSSTVPPPDDFRDVADKPMDAAARGAARWQPGIFDAIGLGLLGGVLGSLGASDRQQRERAELDDRGDGMIFDDDLNEISQRLSPRARAAFLEAHEAAAEVAACRARRDAWLKSRIGCPVEISIRHTHLGSVANLRYAKAVQAMEEITTPELVAQLEKRRTARRTPAVDESKQSVCMDERLHRTADGTVRCACDDCVVRGALDLLVAHDVLVGHATICRDVTCHARLELLSDIDRRKQWLKAVSVDDVLGRHVRACSTCTKETYKQPQPGSLCANGDALARARDLISAG